MTFMLISYEIIISGYKDQYLVLSFTMSLGLAQIDLSQPAVVFSKYAEDLVVYVAHRLIGVARGLIQTFCTSLGVFFSSVGLTISSSKSEVSRKHERSPFLIRIGSHVLPQVTTFKYLEVFFDCGLRWGTHSAIGWKN
jgi:hypothetical protein